MSWAQLVTVHLLLKRTARAAQGSLGTVQMYISIMVFTGSLYLNLQPQFLFAHSFGRKPRHAFPPPIFLGVITCRHTLVALVRLGWESVEIQLAVYWKCGFQSLDFHYMNWVRFIIMIYFI